ncbi:MAG: DNA-methyltransferase [Candidatus Helarchaeota archaeon]
MKTKSDWLNKIHQGDALEVLKQMPDNFVDCIITSPPYWGLRYYGESTFKVWDGDPNCEHEWQFQEGMRYRGGTKNSIGNFKDHLHFTQRFAFCKKCGAWYGQLGLEPTLEMYIDHLLQITAELKRVLKDTGVMYWNHGDCYGGSNCGRYDWRETASISRSELYRYKPSPQSKLKPKCLALQNYRLILRMIDEQDWILRNIVIWYKPNHLPDSVKDRFTRAYEPIFMLVKNKKYWFDLDAVRVEYESDTMIELLNGHNSEEFIIGKNPGDLWTIPVQPFKDAHFATFPPRLIEPMIKSSCPRWVCKKCGKPRERIIERTKVIKQSEPKPYTADTEFITHGTYDSTLHAVAIRKCIGWTDCGCNAGWEAGIVLDPFMGSGTVAIVAQRLGRNWIGIELNPDYIEIANKRLEQEFGLFHNK